MSNLRSVPDVKRVFSYHCDMVKYLEQKDAEKAKDAFIKHIGLALSKFEEVKNKYNEYFVEE